jgi:hypothetical protein
MSETGFTLGTAAGWRFSLRDPMHDIAGPSGLNPGIGSR